MATRLFPHRIYIYFSQEFFNVSFPSNSLFYLSPLLWIRAASASYPACCTSLLAARQTSNCPPACLRICRPCGTTCLWITSYLWHSSISDFFSSALKGNQSSGANHKRCRFNQQRPCTDFRTVCQPLLQCMRPDACAGVNITAKLWEKLSHLQTDRTSIF